MQPSVLQLASGGRPWVVVATIDKQENSVVYAIVRREHVEKHLHGENSRVIAETNTHADAYEALARFLHKVIEFDMQKASILDVIRSNKG